MWKQTDYSRIGCAFKWCYQPWLYQMVLPTVIIFWHSKVMMNTSTWLHLQFIGRNIIRIQQDRNHQMPNCKEIIALDQNLRSTDGIVYIMTRHQIITYNWNWTNTWTRNTRGDEPIQLNSKETKVKLVQKYVSDTQKDEEKKNLNRTCTYVSSYTCTYVSSYKPNRSLICINTTDLTTTLYIKITENLSYKERILSIWNHWLIRYQIRKRRSPACIKTVGK